MGHSKQFFVLKTRKQSESKGQTQSRNFRISFFINGFMLLLFLCFLRTLKKMAERQGFEPWALYNRATVFETAPFDHSGISPEGYVTKAKDNKKRESKATVLAFLKDWPVSFFVSGHKKCSRNNGRRFHTF